MCFEFQSNQELRGYFLDQETKRSGTELLVTNLASSMVQRFATIRRNCSPNIHMYQSFESWYSEKEAK